MTRLISLLLLVTLLIPACSIPDDGDEDRFSGSILNMPADALKALRGWSANRYTAGYINGLGRGNNTRIVSVNCEGAGRTMINSRMVLDCLNEDQVLTYMMCLKKILAEIQDSDFGALGLCELDNDWAVGYAPDDLPDECDPERNDAERIFDTLTSLKAPPPLWVQTILFGAGLFAAANILCPLADKGPVLPDWGCPSSPFESSPPPQGAGSGGDR